MTSASHPTSSLSSASPMPSASVLAGQKHKRDEVSVAKVAEKKARIAKFGLQFKSAGTLMTVDGSQRMTPGDGRLFSYQEPGAGSRPAPPPLQPACPDPTTEDSKKFSFELGKKPPSSSSSSSLPSASRLPPKLMSRQRELTMSRAFSAESDSEEEEDEIGRSLMQLQRRGPKFKFKIKES